MMNNFNSAYDIVGAAPLHLFKNAQFFSETSSAAGNAFLISDPGHYVGCVSAQQYHGSGNARLQKLDGVVTARFQNKDMKNTSTCASGSAAGTLPSGGQA